MGHGVTSNNIIIIKNQCTFLYTVFLMKALESTVREQN